MKCANCKRASEHDICPGCWKYAVEQLHTFPARYTELENELLPSSGHRGERVSGSKDLPVPVRLETLNLRSGGISKPLMKHETLMRQMRRETKITFRGDELSKITLTCEYHIKRSTWSYDEYGDLASLTKDIISISNTINYTLGHKSEDIVIGSCPTTDENGIPCNTKLKVNPQTKSPDITCRACGTVWPSSRWRLLGRMLENGN